MNDSGDVIRNDNQERVSGLYKKRYKERFRGHSLSWYSGLYAGRVFCIILFVLMVYFTQRGLSLKIYSVSVNNGIKQIPKDAILKITQKNGGIIQGIIQERCRDGIKERYQGRHLGTVSVNGIKEQCQERYLLRCKERHSGTTFRNGNQWLYGDMIKVKKECHIKGVKRTYQK